MGDLLTLGRGAPLDAQALHFVRQHGWTGTAQAMAGDAGSRRYWRLLDGGRHALLMDCRDAPGALDGFLRMQPLLAAAGLSAPEVLAAEGQLAVVEDFGDRQFSAAVVEAGRGEAEALYAQAVDALVQLHRAWPQAQLATRTELPAWDVPRFVEQGLLITEVAWPLRLGRACPADAVAELRAALQAVLAPAAALPQSLLLRDLEAQNVMLLPGRPGVRRLGFIDFQDGGVGPVLYDLASLLQDARRDEPAAFAAEMTRRYCRAMQLDVAAAEAAMAAMAAQRQLRIVAIFMRLGAAGRPHYLAHLPGLWRRLDANLRHPALAPLAAWAAHRSLDALRHS